MPSAVGSAVRSDGAPPHPSTTAQGGGPGAAAGQGNAEEPISEAQDPLAHMSEADKFGLKGFSYMMNNYPDYAALVAGSDPSNIGFDLSSPE